MAEATGYIICTSPRSGSTLLCTMLAATGRAGRPCSFFHQPDFMREWAEAWGLQATESMPADAQEAAYLGATAAAGRCGTGVFGMRLQEPYLALLGGMLARRFPSLANDRERLRAAFGPLRYVHLTRADKVAQAVSLVRARQTGLWHRHADGSERERSGQAADPVYDAAAIRTEVEALTRADRSWRRWFQHQAIEPLPIGYEALADDPVGTAARLCGALGIALPDAAALLPSTARLADEVSREWVTRYQASQTA
jgi:LPS sulfotransferase NodH